MGSIIYNSSNIDFLYWTGAGIQPTPQRQMHCHTSVYRASCRLFAYRLPLIRGGKEFFWVQLEKRDTQGVTYRVRHQNVTRGATYKGRHTVGGIQGGIQKERQRVCFRRQWWPCGPIRGRKSPFSFNYCSGGSARLIYEDPGAGVDHTPGCRTANPVLTYTCKEKQRK
jgi:hypothetical protein